ncbi:MAG: DUF2948 family protein [Bradyrhizobiaceae bacterium]|nr:DUF2948 family protein [Bradyrhizobiaceae bacterium]
MAPDLKNPLKLLALDSDDLAVVSAHLQDAAVKVADMAYLPKEKRFAMLLDRFDWSAIAEGKVLRRRAGVHFERVESAHTRGLDLKQGQAALTLLAVEFAERNAPSGVISLYFSSGAAIQLEVECLEAALSDLGPEWPAEERPAHAED